MNFTYTVVLNIFDYMFYPPIVNKTININNKIVKVNKEGAKEKIIEKGEDMTGYQNTIKTKGYNNHYSLRKYLHYIWKTIKINSEIYNEIENFSTRWKILRKNV